MHEDHSTTPEESKSITNFGMLYSVAVISILNRIQRKVKFTDSRLTNFQPSHAKSEEGQAHETNQVIWLRRPKW
jgi:hypothetical protein